MRGKWIVAGLIAFSLSVFSAGRADARGFGGGGFGFVGGFGRVGGFGGGFAYRGGGWGARASVGYGGYGFGGGYPGYGYGYYGSRFGYGGCDTPIIIAPAVGAYGCGGAYCPAPATFAAPIVVPAAPTVVYTAPTVTIYRGTPYYAAPAVANGYAYGSARIYYGR